MIPAKRNIAIAMAVVALLLIIVGVWVYRRSLAPSPDAIASPSPVASVTPETTVTPSPQPTAATYKRLRAQDIAAVPKVYQYSVEVPQAWQAEVVQEIEAINLYDPAAPGASNLEKSQVFVRYFQANDFLTLSTVTILDRQTLTIKGRTAVRYRIKKKAGVANFPNQPTWRNEEHIVTDIRMSDTTPSIFLVIAKRPDLSDAVYQHLFDSIRLDSIAGLQEPIAEFTARITKKKFGQYITPANSPVQPERFTGYHTGVDVEYADVSGNVPVRSIADGEVVVARTSSGYGGVLVIRHTIDGAPRLAVYGHVDPASMAKVGQAVTRGETIAQLGQGGTSETDGERKHLHFAILKGTDVDLRGYVASQAELAKWLDPLSLFN